MTHSAPDEFYVNCTSKKNYAENPSSNFNYKLNSDVDLLEGKHEVALTHISYPRILSKITYQVNVLLSIIQPSESRNFENSDHQFDPDLYKVLKVLYPDHDHQNRFLIGSSTPVLSNTWTVTGPEYHRVTPQILREFTVKLVDHEGNRLEEEGTDPDNRFLANTFIGLHFRKIGMQFQAAAAEDVPRHQPSIHTQNYLGLRL